MMGWDRDLVTPSLAGASFQLFLGGPKRGVVGEVLSIRGGSRQSFIDSRGVVGEVLSIRGG